MQKKIMEVSDIVTVLGLLEYMAGKGSFTTSEFSHVGKLTNTLQSVVNGTKSTITETVVRDVIHLLQIAAKRGAFTVDQFVLVGTTFETLQKGLRSVSKQKA